ncbi:hypothetical protein, partial [Kingella kingae]|uniref:hypothetical protein n=1 Tax=Kingella kingae TaxID=504 RepID=UPI001E28A90F
MWFQHSQAKPSQHKTAIKRILSHLIGKLNADLPAKLAAFVREMIRMKTVREARFFKQPALKPS